MQQSKQHKKYLSHLLTLVINGQKHQFLVYNDNNAVVRKQNWNHEEISGAAWLFDKEVASPGAAIWEFEHKGGKFTVRLKSVDAIGIEPYNGGKTHTMDYDNPLCSEEYYENPLM